MRSARVPSLRSSQSKLLSSRARYSRSVLINAPIFVLKWKRSNQSCIFFLVTLRLQLEADIQAEHDKAQLLQERTKYFASATADEQEREMTFLDNK